MMWVSSSEARKQVEIDYLTLNIEVRREAANPHLVKSEPRIVLLKKYSNYKLIIKFAVYSFSVE